MRNIKIANISVHQIKYLSPSIKKGIKNGGFEGRFHDIYSPKTPYENLKFESFGKVKEFLFNVILPSRTRYPVYADQTIGDAVTLDFVITENGVVSCCFYVKDNGCVASKEDMIMWAHGEYRHLWLRLYKIYLKVEEYVPDRKELASWNTDNQPALSLVK